MYSCTLLLLRSFPTRRSSDLNADFRDGIVIGFNPPPIPGLSTTGGFEFYLQDRSGRTLEALAQAAQRVVQAANKRPEDRKSTRLNSSHLGISYAVFCLKKKIL